MNWLNKIVDELIKRHPNEEIIVSSGVSPSGTYHIGTLREVLTAEIVAREIRQRGGKAKHIHVVDDLDVFRKVPVDVPADFKQFLGKPLCDVPAPDGSNKSYADYFLSDLLIAADGLHLDIEILRAHEKYRSGFFVDAIEKSLDNVKQIREILEKISGHKLGDEWSPVQVVEDGYLKNRQFVSIDNKAKTITYKDNNGKNREASYDKGEVKLNWRIDWPARWWLLGVNAEPFGRDHATKGGSYDTGEVIVSDVFGASAPYPIPYHFINRTGDTKKMSKSAGDTITATELLKILPPELVWFFIIRYAPDKQLFFDDQDTLIRLFDEFSELLSKPDKTDSEEQLLRLCLQGVSKPTVSKIPFSHLVACYQSALHDSSKTIEILKRTGHDKVASADEATIIAELKFIDVWLKERASDEVRFNIEKSLKSKTGQQIVDQLTDVQKQFLSELASKIENAPKDADGAWFHTSIYEFKDQLNLSPKELFETLYKVLINKTYGPRAGWFLSILPRDWLIKRLKLED